MNHLGDHRFRNRRFDLPSLDSLQKGVGAFTVVGMIAGEIAQDDVGVEEAHR